MCPVCMTTVAMITAGATSTGGLTAVVVAKLRNRNPQSQQRKEERDGTDD